MSGKIIRMRYDNETGAVNAEALNFEGPGCLAATNAVLAAAGLEVDASKTQLKPEYSMETTEEVQREIG